MSRYNSRYKRCVGTIIYREQGISKIFWPYFVATFVYTLAIEHMFDLKNFIIKLIYFNATLPFYYVFLYIQLTLTNVILYKIIQKCNMSKHVFLNKVFVSVAILIISSLTIQYTNMLDIYGGGGKLFGGTYLLLAYFGILIAPYMLKNRSGIKRLFLCVFTSVLWLLWYEFASRDFFNLDARLPFGEGINPPGITLMSYAVIILFWCFAVFSNCENNNLCINKLIGIIKLIGENSMYIFLYHRLILDYFLCPYVVIENIWIKRFCYLLCMICIPILGKRLYMEVRNKLELSGKVK